MSKQLIGGDDALHLFPLAYPWAWDAYLASMDNHWTPREIAVGEDVSLWKGNALSDAERHLVLSIMAQLTTFDVQRGDDLAESMQRVISAPECKQFMKRMADEEALHTWSYQYMIENFGLDPEDIYTRYKRIPVMRDRVDMGARISRDVALIAARKVISGESDYSDEEITTIVISLAFWFLCFEGVWFYLNLAGPIQSLARNGKMTGMAKQFQYILRDETGHIDFGVGLINGIIDEHPHLMTHGLVNSIRSAVDAAITLEDEFIDYCLPTPIMGYDAEDHKSTARALANQRLASVGLDAYYVNAQHMFPWMAEQSEIRKESNFFETRVTEYRSGGALRWDD